MKSPTNILMSDLFIPQRHCYLWKPELIGLHLGANLTIAIAYLSMPLTLFYFVEQREDLPFNWIFTLFGAVIIFCGTTHLLEVLSITQRGVVAINILLVCLFLSLGTHVFLHQATLQSAQKVEQIQTVLRESRTLLFDLLNAETAVGGIGAAIAAKLFKNLAQELQARELQLQESNSLIRAIFGNIVDGVVTLDAHGQIESCNQAAIVMFGYEKSALIGQNWTILLGTESQNLISLPIAGKVEADDMGHLWQTMGQRNNGDYFPIEISISTIELNDRHIAIIRDITLRQQTEAKLQSRAAELARLNLTLRRTKDTLAERNQELDKFAYVTSHDLKASLRAISNLSSWIAEDLEGALPPESHNQLRLLRGRINRMDSLLDGLLEYSRIGRKSVSIELTNVNELVLDVIKTLDPPSIFQIEIAPNLPILATRRLLLKQVFLNLIDNAIEHHPRPDGTVKITVADCGDRYEFAVTDDGQGIEPQYHEKIYTIFQTLQARDTHESMGVGLAIVKKIVETEGVTIGLKSSLGRGSTFSFTWLKYPLDQVIPTVVKN